MKHYLIILPLMIVLLSFGNNLKAEEFAVEIAQHHIDVTVGFTGSSIVLFGDRRDVDADVAIVVEGPRKDITMWKKAKVMGTWINRYYMTLKNMPVYYSYASTISEDVKGDNIDLIMRYNGIGHRALFTSVDMNKSRSVKDVEEFQNSFLKKKIYKGVYFEKPATIKFYNDYFFGVRFEIPASAQTGAYKIHSFLIKNGKVIEKRTQKLRVQQVGVNAFVYNLAYRHSLFYAISCIALALFCGWFASVVRVRP